ncbi:Uncharacterised protein [Listeria fleischmannii subsp. fleischmannii]|uniref:Uncharacterized protein n=1 Tax=Listeria fleischmannii subsp. fleischmannii TaxID=1671902 RepID=A0A2X3H840_9LIST|nr:Uncharacterised protein [Listeria fleischmannii subsp. fleischmannii]
MIDLKERLSRIYGADVACELGKRIETRILETKRKRFIVRRSGTKKMSF